MTIIHYKIGSMRRMGSGANMIDYMEGKILFRLRYSIEIKFLMYNYHFGE